MSDVTDIIDFEHFKKKVNVCIGVFLLLMALTFITVGVSYFHIGKAGSNLMNIIVALVIAAIKASLVAAYFMHLNSEKRAIYRILIFTGIFATGLMFLTLGSFHDGVTFP